MKIEITLALTVDAPDEREYPGQAHQEYADHFALAIADTLADGGDEARVISARPVFETPRPAPGAIIRAHAARVLYEAVLDEAEFGRKPTMH